MKVENEKKNNQMDNITATNYLVYTESRLVNDNPIRNRNRNTKPV